MTSPPRPVSCTSMPQAASAPAGARMCDRPPSPPDAEGKHVGMLDQQQHVVDPAGAAIFDERVLQRERRPHTASHPDDERRGCASRVRRVPVLELALD